MNVTVADVLAGAEVRAVPLSAECVGYLVLAAADQICGAPRRVAANDVLLCEDGGVRVASARASEGPVAERDLRAVLDALLLRASAPTGGLLRASRRAPGAGLEALVRELETALIPVNRAAAKRALARLERETVRALESGRIRPSTAPPGEPEASARPVPQAPAIAAEAGTRETSAPPPGVAPREPSAPLPSVVERELSAAAPPAVQREPSAPGPEVALASSAARAVSSALSPHAPVVAPPVALPSALVANEAFVPQDHTLVLAPVAPREQPDATLVETRPEPVVVRASARPPAPPQGLESIAAEPVRTEPLPRVAPLPVLAAPIVARPPRLTPAAPPVILAPEAPPAVTPVLGTRMVETELPALEPQGVEAEVAFEPQGVEVELALEPQGDALEAPIPAQVVEDDDLEIVEVLLGQEELTILPSDEELIYAEGSDWTEPCPPIAAESMLPPPSIDMSPLLAEPAEAFVEQADVVVEQADVVVEQANAVVEQADPVVEQADVVAEQADAVAEQADAVVEQADVVVEPIAAALERGAESLEPAFEEASELPAWVTAVHTAPELTPPPRVALPEPRPSDVEDLLLRLGDAPLAVDELHSGLKRLAGMEPTPPPPGSAHGD